MRAMRAWPPGKAMRMWPWAVPVAGSSRRWSGPMPAKPGRARSAPRRAWLRLTSTAARQFAFVQARQQFGEIAGAEAYVELVIQYLVPAVAAGAGRAGQGEQIGAAGHAGGGARLDGRGADLLEADPTEQLAETVDLLLEHRFEGFGGDVA